MLPTSYQEFIHKSRYARWLEEEGRRENWGERKMDERTKKEEDIYLGVYHPYPKEAPKSWRMARMQQLRKEVLLKYQNCSTIRARTGCEELFVFDKFSTTKSCFPCRYGTKVMQEFIAL